MLCKALQLGQLLLLKLYKLCCLPLSHKRTAAAAAAAAG
jgi:hypothetical protein